MGHEDRACFKDGKDRYEDVQVDVVFAEKEKAVLHRTAEKNGCCECN